MAVDRAGHLGRAFPVIISDSLVLCFWSARLSLCVFVCIV